jgi:3-hydroxyisobutyrate dehydrogenase-like beta-hydroxyacid dehydrogenase
MAQQMKVGFIGLGRMGRPMARRLAEAGHAVAVFNRTAGRAAGLGPAVRVASSPADAARGADVVFTMLADDEAVAAVALEGASPLVGALAKGAVHVSASTISVALGERLTAAHEAAGQGFVSAPVFGRPEAAEAGKHWVVAAGRDDAIARCRPLFDAVGQGVFVVGAEPPRANAVKLAGNFTIAALLETFGEAFALVRRYGIPPDEFLRIIDTALYQSPIYRAYGSRVAKAESEPAGFALRLGLKDVRLALQAADTAAVPMPLASVIHDHFVSAVARGKGDADWSALGEIVAANAGLPPR